MLSFWHRRANARCSERLAFDGSEQVEGVYGGHQPFGRAGKVDTTVWEGTVAPFCRRRSAVDIHFYGAPKICLWDVLDDS